MLCLTVVFAGGCSDDGGPGGPPPDLSRLSPLDPTELRFLFMAENELVRRCMANRGFEYSVIVPPIEDFVPSTGTWPEVDLDERRQVGYGIAVHDTGPPIDPHSDGQQGGDPNQRYLATLSTQRQREWQTALFGTDSNAISVEFDNGGVIATNADGCLSEARVQLYGDLSNWLYLDHTANGFSGQASVLAKADPRYAQAYEQWASCMRERGFDFEDRGDALDAAAEIAASIDVVGRQAAIAREVEVAVADGECDIQVELTETVNRLIRENVGQVNEEQLGDVLALQSLQREALVRARELGVI